MTPQLLIVKIQALLGGRAEMSSMQKRSLAMEYYRQCVEAESQIEHCIALIKADREYTALQVAESAALLDKINALLFEQLNQWRDYCKTEGLPFPEPFDYSQIEQISALYSKGITQAHPLYRDYRRAMRMRKYEDALSVIRTISKINALDGEARREYERLRKSVAESRLAELEEALKEDDSEKIVALTESLESDGDLLSENPVWKGALAKKLEKEKVIAQNRMREIAEKLKLTDPEADWQQTVGLVTEFNFLREIVPALEDDLEILEERSRKASAKQDEEMAREKAAQAKNLLYSELENSSKGSARKKLAVLNKLRAAAGDLPDEELNRRLDSKASKLKRSIFISAATYSVAALAALACVGGIFFVAVNAHKAGIMESAALEELSAINNIRDFNELEVALREFEEKYPSISRKNYFAGRIVEIREASELGRQDISRLEGQISDIEAIDFAVADSAIFDRAKESLDKIASESSLLPRKYQSGFKDRIEALTKRYNAAFDERRLTRSAQMRSGLDKYEALVARYDSLDEEKEVLDLELTSVLKVLRPIIEDTSGSFRAHQIDVDRFNDITARIAQSRSRYLKITNLMSEVMAARTVDSFLSALENISKSPDLSADFERKVSRIASQKDKIKLGQLAEFGLGDINEAINMPISFSKHVFPENEILTNVYRYTRGDKGNVYTLGAVSQNFRSWNTGSEISQEADEIGLGGKTSKVIYRQNNIRGRAPQGEILTEGALSNESMLGAGVIKTAATNSLLAALTMVANANVNPAYKLYWENLILREMKRNPVESGFAYLPSLQARAESVEKYAKGYTDYSWIFERPSRLNLLNAELYADFGVDYVSEARGNKVAIRAALKDPLYLMGICDEKGVWQIFKDNKGAIWAVDSAGNFRRFDAAPADNDIAPLSPILSEVKDAEALLKTASENK